MVSVHVDTETHAQYFLAAQWQFEIFQPDADHVMPVALKSENAVKPVQWRFMEP